jgi:hemerythrin
MNRGSFAVFFILLLGFILLTSCTSPSNSRDQQPASEPISAETTSKDTAPVEEEPEPEQPPEPEQAPEQEPEPADEPQEPEETDFSVSEEVYKETFKDIRLLIDELNAIIREENYKEWLAYLTEDYKDHFSDPEVLKQNSDQPLLKKYSIELNSLRDYFKNVVVPSRSNVRLDDIVFVDNEHVKAIMIFNNKRTILYQLEKSEDGWKIGL